MATISIYSYKILLQFLFVSVKYCYNLYLLEWNIATIYICLGENIATSYIC